MMCSFVLQAPTKMTSSAGNECTQRKLHYHPDLPTASHSLLQLYHQNGPEDLGPKAVRTTIVPAAQRTPEQVKHHIPKTSGSCQYWRDGRLLFSLDI